jgi:hypothetical protein
MGRALIGKKELAPSAASGSADFALFAPLREVKRTCGICEFRGAKSVF